MLAYQHIGTGLHCVQIKRVIDPPKLTSPKRERGAA